MQREQFNPDIEVKFDQLLAHMTEKNTIIEEFMRILREMCDAQIFYSRSLDKFANNISKLIVGKDPLKQVFIIFERAIAAKSQQSVQLAKNIKDDMIPFLQQNAIDPPFQQQLKAKQQSVKDIRSLVQHKLRKLRVSQSSYRRAYQQLSKKGSQSRADLQQKQRLKISIKGKEQNLGDCISSYNHTVEQYLLNYTGICQKLSDIQTKRKNNVRDAINKFMIFEISCIKNIEYNIPRYMKNLEKMSDRLLIQDKIAPSNPNSTAVNLATINIPNYLSHLQDHDHSDTPTPHKTVLEIKKNTSPIISLKRYHELVKQLNQLMDDLKNTFNIKVLKQIVYFSMGIKAYLEKQEDKDSPQRSEKPYSSSSLSSEHENSPSVLLLDAVMCHPIFQYQDFWNKYQNKLQDIISKQKRSVSFNSQNKDVQISLSFLAGDLQFLRIVGYHFLPNSILSKFSVQGEGGFVPKRLSPPSALQDNFVGNLQYLE